MSPQQYKLLADAVLLVHAAIVVFVVLGLPLILAGGALGWTWVRNSWWRAAHLAAIAYVAGQQLLGVACPLTGLELSLRLRAGQPAYSGDFVAYWLARLMFYQAPAWVFSLLYAGFAIVVALSWLYVPPVYPWARRRAHGNRQR
ncbi:MAG TPA: DUF2784 domain-containing protein [Telluria sp.]